MFGLRGAKSQGAGREWRAGDGRVLMPLAVFSILLLAACQVPPQAAAPAPVQNAEAAHSPLPPKPTPLPATPAVAHGATIAPTARLSGDPEELIGLDNSAIRRVLGAPAQVRHEFTAQVWQYVTGDCVVDLYLYNKDGGGLKVTYVEARSRSAEPTPTDRCLKSLLERPTASAQ